MLKKARSGSLKDSETRLIMSQLVKGMRDLHNQGIVHRDIKLANVLLNFRLDNSDPLITSCFDNHSGDDLLTLNKR